MNILHLSKTKDQWIALLSNQQQLTITEWNLENVTLLLNWLKEQQVVGGTIAEKILFTNEQALTAELADYLTEKLNRPFVIGDADQWTEKASEIPWKITYEGYTPGKDEYSVESLLTVGNGFMGIRGTTPEMAISEDHYPATYLASLYNTAYSEVSGQMIANEDFVNAPNVQKMTICLDEERFDFSKGQLHSLTRELNLKTGLFKSWATVELSQGKQIALHTKRFVSMKNVHETHVSYTVTPLNFSGEMTLITEVDGDVYNYNVARYRELNQKHLDVLTLEQRENDFLLMTRTKESKITIVQQGTLRSNDVLIDHLTSDMEDQKLTQKLQFMAEKNQSYTFERTTTTQQYRKEEALPEVSWTQDYADFTTAYQASKLAWEQLWERAAIVVEGDLMSQKLLNLHTYHVLASASPNANKNLDASVTARGLHGEAYRGHIFWDELFIMPFYLAHFPETAKELLMYRYRRLPQAKINAREAGYQGSMYPWQSGLDGTEQSQKLHLNPISGKWKEDHSRLQRHVSLAVAYNVWQYYNQTDDKEFMLQYGLEMLLEIAHFWQSTVVYNETTHRYSIPSVMGPDEFHESYPDAEKGGLTDNAYTNMMVVWLFETIQSLQNDFNEADFRELLIKTEVPDDFIEQLEQIKQRLTLEIDSDGVIAQFSGYFDLKELDWEAYREKYGNIYRMDRILNAEGKSADTYKVAKQADTLMIFYNFAKAQVDQILTDLNYSLPSDYVEKNLDYYLKRTSHGSTLSRVVHAQLASMVDQDDFAWQLFKEALGSDYRDIQGGTTAEGIHAGVMAATLWIPLSTFAGLDLRQNKVQFQPKLPKHWDSIQFSFCWKQIDFRVSMTKSALTITATQDCTIELNQQTIALTKNQTTTQTY